MSQKRLEELRSFKRSELNSLAAKLHMQAAKGRRPRKFPVEVMGALGRCSRPLTATPEDVLVLEEFLRSVQNH